MPTTIFAASRHSVYSHLLEDAVSELTLLGRRIYERYAFVNDRWFVTEYLCSGWPASLQKSCITKLKIFLSQAGAAGRNILCLEILLTTRQLTRGRAVQKVDMALVQVSSTLE